MITVRIYLILVLFFSSCQRKNSLIENSNSIVKLEIYYVPWEFNSQAQWTEYEVRDTSTSYISYFCSKSPSTIKQFAGSFDHDSMKLKPDINGVPPYMLISMEFVSGRKQTLRIGPDIYYLEYEGKTYLVSKRLKDWISSKVPVATFPEGSKHPNCE